MARTLSMNMLSAAVQVVVQMLVLFLLYRYLIHSIGIEQLGVWAIVLSTASTARISELGLSGSVTKFVAGYRSDGKDHYAQEAVQTAAISLALLLACILAALYPCLLWALPSILPLESIPAGRLVLPYALVSLWLAAIGGVWMAALDGYLRSDLRAALMIFCTVIYFGAALGGVSQWGLEGLAVAQVLQSLILATMGWMLVRKVARIAGYLPVKWSRARLRDMLRYGVNFQINSVVMLLFEPTTKILFGRYGELAAAGYFELAQRLVARVRALIVETNRVIVPVLAGTRQGDDKARDLYCKNVRYLFFLLTPLFAMLLALLPSISELWIGSYQDVFVTIGIFLVLAWYMNSMTAPAYFAYLGSGNLKWVTTSHVVLGSTNIFLGLLLGRAFGWRGIITAFAVSLVVGSLITIVSYQRENRIRTMRMLSRNDYVLGAFCVGVAAAALTAYELMRVSGIDAFIRTAVIACGAVLVLGCAVIAHPLTREFAAIVRASVARKLAC